MPDEQLPLSHVADPDVGDDVQRRFRYQHGYGVVLLIAALRQENDYVAVWCEHHEDLLAQKANGRFDGFQVKTLQDGPWKTNDAGFCKSVGRFAKLQELAQGQIENFNFVSNARLFETGVFEDQHLCPGLVVAEVKSAESLEKLNGARKGVQAISAKTLLGEEAIFGILKKVKFVTSMPLDGFESLIAHEHLPKVDGCAGLSATLLSKIVDRMVSMIYKASSMAVADPSRHYAPLLATGAVAAEIAGKRVTKDMFRITITDCVSPAFRYQAGLGILKESTPDTWKLLRQKMDHGGIADFFDYMHRRAISAEELLFEFDPSSDTANQIENLVADQCDEVRLKYLQEKEPCGDKILQATIERFEQMSKEERARVHYQSPEMLMGVAGLLAGDCKVWWSKPFDLGGNV